MEPGDDPAAGYEHAAALVAELDAAPAWPLPREAKARAQAVFGRAFRKNEDVDALKALAEWPSDRNYYPDALARRISLGFADFLFAEDFTLTLGEKVETGPYEDVITENRLPSRLHRAERIAISEGEVWWKLHRNIAISPVAMISFGSRRDVVPSFYGDRVIAAAFVSEVGTTTAVNDKGEPTSEAPRTVWRHVELHAAGLVWNLLYRGEPDKLGRRVELSEHASTAAYREEWKHGLPMLAGRITNDLDDDDTLGESEYTGVKTHLFGLNEAITIGMENARLTGKDRIMAAGKLVKGGTFDASLDVFEVEQDGATMGDSSGVPVVAIEKRYDAEPLWLHIDKLVRLILSRVGLVAQVIGDVENSGGSAESGVARRLMFLPTTNSARGKARTWLGDLPKILALMLKVPEVGGAVTGGELGELPAVELRDPIPRDQSEEVTDHATAVGAEIESRETAIREMHPEWTKQEVDDELARIKADREDAMPEALRVPPPGGPEHEHGDPPPEPPDPLEDPE